MSIMESQCGSIPYPKPKPKALEVTPLSPADFNETLLQPVQDRNVDFSKGKSMAKNHKIRSFKRLI